MSKTTLEITAPQGIEVLADVEGSKGCFPKGTAVKTPEGFKSIESFDVGDSIVVYDEDGNLVDGKVIETHVHDTTETKDQFVKVNHTGGSFRSTFNHWILTKGNGYVEAGQLPEGAIVYDANGYQHEVVSVEFQKPEPFSYNLTTEPHSCFIADGVRVHNKGGGKGGGTPRAAVEDPNTLSSRQTAMVLEIVSEGEIEEITDAYLDDNPIGNIARTSAYYRTGTSTQDFIPGFSDVESEHPVDVVLTNATPYAAQMSQIGIDSVRVTHGVDSLFSQNTTNGDLHGASVSFAFDIKQEGGVWTSIGSYTLKGKTMSPFAIAVRINVGSSYSVGLWSFRIRRTTPDNDTSSLQRPTRMISYTEIIDKKLSYPNTALIGWRVDSEATGGHISRRSVRTKGIKVRIPDNYDPVNRTYSGIWSGTLTTTRYYTNNPVWILFDLITHDRYGAGISDQDVDKFSFYDAAVYCDGMVDDGNGGTEPRFTFNTQIFVRDDAYKVLQAIASTARAFVTYVGGVIKLIQDRPAPVEDILTNDDVIDGRFEYSSAALSARYNVVNVTYNNPDNRFLQEIVTETDSSLIAKYGSIDTNIAAYGCTSEGQARRLAKWKIDTDNTNVDVVTYKIPLNRLRTEPGRVVDIYDENYATIKGGGKVIASDGTSIQFDSQLTLPAETIYVQFYGQDGETLYKIVVNETNTTTDTVTGVFADPALVGSTAQLFGDVVPRPFRIDTVSFDPEEQIFDVVGIFYDEGKFARVEQGIIVDTPQFADPGFYTQEPPQNLTYVEEQYDDGAGTQKKRLQVRWDAPVDNAGASYEMSWRRDNTEWKKIDEIYARQYTIDDALPGVYEFLLYAYNPRGVRSQALSGTYTLDTTTASALLPPTNLQVKGGGTAFESPDCTVEWTNNPGNDGLSATLNAWIVEIYDSTGTTLKDTVVLPRDVTEYTLTFVQNRTYFGSPVRTFQIKVYARDALSRYSTKTSIVPVNSAPAAPSSLTITDGFESYWVSATYTRPLDFDGLYLAEGTTSGFTPSTSNITYRGDGTEINIPSAEGVTKYVKAAVIDTFDDDPANLNWTTAFTATAQGVTPPDVQEYRYEDLYFVADPVTNTVTWSAGRGIDLNTGATWAINGGTSVPWTTSVMYFYNIPTNNTVHTTLSLSIATGGVILGSYRGGSNFQGEGNGGAYIDGGKVLAQTIGANQLVADSAVITNEAQMGHATINTAAIQALSVGNGKIKDAAISTAKIQDLAVNNAKIDDLAVTEAKINALAVSNAKIQNAAVDTLQVANGAITDVYTWNDSSVSLDDSYYSDTYQSQSVYSFTKGTNDTFLLINWRYYVGTINSTLERASSVYHYSYIDIFYRPISGPDSSIKVTDTQMISHINFGDVTDYEVGGPPPSYAHRHGFSDFRTFGQGLSLSGSTGIDLSGYATGDQVVIELSTQKNRTNSLNTITQSGASFSGNMIWWTR